MTPRVISMPRRSLALPRQTERLVLRAFRPGDESDVLAYRKREDVCRYMPAEPLNATSAAQYVADRLETTKITANNDCIVLAAELGGRVIGDVMIRSGQLADKQAEIGWAFNPEYHGHGYATEAARELLAIAFTELGMHRAWAQLDPRNTASARVCERMGMRHEAHLRHDIWFKGEWGDTAIYALLADEWRDRA
jgi:RimJ/RimL family protein N-acetyltransferase